MHSKQPILFIYMRLKIPVSKDEENEMVISYITSPPCDWQCVYCSLVSLVLQRLCVSHLDCSMSR